MTFPLVCKGHDHFICTVAIVKYIKWLKIKRLFFNIHNNFKIFTKLLIILIVNIVISYFGIPNKEEGSEPPPAAVAGALMHHLNLCYLCCHLQCHLVVSATSRCHHLNALCPNDSPSRAILTVCQDGRP